MSNERDCCMCGHMRAQHLGEGFCRVRGCACVSFYRRTSFSAGPRCSRCARQVVGLQSVPVLCRGCRVVMAGA